MSPTWIEIDDDVLAKIKEGAEPFTDSPNDVLRRIFGFKIADRPSCSPVPSAQPPDGHITRDRPVRSRAQAGELLSMADYELPLLRALSQLGGSAPRWKVKEAVEGLMADKLTAVDRLPLQHGEIRWENRLGFARLKAVDRGLLRSGSRRGIWELTDAGIERLGELEAELQEREKAAPR